MDQYVLTRFSNDVLRLFDPWSNFEHVQKLSRMAKDVRGLSKKFVEFLHNFFI